MKKLYGIWSPSKGWWYTQWLVFHTDNYAIALAQLDVVQRNFARIFDTVIHYEIRLLPGNKVDISSAEREDKTAVTERCQTCQGTRIASITGRCKDSCWFKPGDREDVPHPPEWINSAGDDMYFQYCLDCGQIQGQFPVKLTEAEKIANEPAGD